jgi:hypothetical protein
MLHRDTLALLIRKMRGRGWMRFQRTVTEMPGI